MITVLFAASVNDLHDYHVSNKLIVAGWLLDLVVRFYYQGISGMGAGIISILLSNVLFMPLFCIGGMGAGDIKLLSVICGMHGVDFWLRTVIVFGILSAILSFIHILRKHLLWKRFYYFFHYYFIDRQGSYYSADRDGRDMVIPLSPVAAAAYCIVCLY